MKSKFAIFTATYVTGSILLFLSSFLKTDTNSIEQASRYWGVITLLQFIIFLILFFLKHKTLNKPYLYFLFAAFICWFGQIIVVLFNMHIATQPIIYTFNPRDFFVSLQFASISFFVLSIIGLLFIKKVDYGNYTKKISDPIFKTSLNIVGTGLALIGGFFYTSTQISNLRTSLNYGYSAIFNSGQSSDAVSNIVSNLGMFFIPGVIILFVANKQSKVIRTFLVSVLIASVLVSLSTGGRGGAIALILAMFYLYTSEVQKLSKIKIFFVGIFGFILVKILNAIAEYRTLADRSFDTFIGLVISGNSQGGSTLGNILNEFGFNIFSLYHTIKLIPSHQDFAYGYTYLASFMAIIPSYFFGGFSFSSAAALPDWLKNVLGMDYGPGYSIVAESFYNFGWFGIIAMGILGFILLKMLSNNKTNTDLKSLQNGFIAIVLYANLFIARDTSLFVFRKYFYMILIPLFLIMIVYTARTALQRRKNG